MQPALWCPALEFDAGNAWVTTGAQPSLTLQPAGGDLLCSTWHALSQQVPNELILIASCLPHTPGHNVHSGMHGLLIDGGLQDDETEPVRTAQDDAFIDDAGVEPDDK